MALGDLNEFIGAQSEVNGLCVEYPLKHDAFETARSVLRVSL